MLGAVFTEFCDRAYLEEKISACLKARMSNLAECEPHLKYLASTINARKLDLPVADSKNAMDELAEEPLKVLRDKIATMLGHVNRQYPLVKSEKVVRDDFTFLTDDCGGHTKGTPLLIRKTNKSTMVLFFDNLQYGKGVIKFRKPVAGINRDFKYKAPALKSAKLKGPESLILDFFTSLLEELGKQIGAAIFESIFPKKESDLEKLLKNLKDDIRKIFREELDDMVVTNVNAQIKGVVTFMQNTYLPAKEAGMERKELERMLLAQHADMTTHLMSLIVDQRYRSTGIAFLVTGANAHLAMIQELAAVDPMSPDPSKSHYMKTYKMTLQGYIDALINARLEVYNKRLTYLGNPEESTLQGAATDHWWFQDKWVDPPYKSDDFYNSHDCCDYKMDARSKASAARDVYMTSPFIPTIINDLTPYQRTVDGWTALEKTLK